jgi:hypothetical protein
MQYDPRFAYQLYKLERGLTPSEQRDADRRRGEMAAAIERACRSLTRAVAWAKAKTARSSAFLGRHSLKPSEVR